MVRIKSSVANSNSTNNAISSHFLSLIVQLSQTKGWVRLRNTNSLFNWYFHSRPIGQKAAATSSIKVNKTISYHFLSLTVRLSQTKGWVRLRNSNSLFNWYFHYRPIGQKASATSSIRANKTISYHFLSLTVRLSQTKGWVRLRNSNSLFNWYFHYRPIGQKASATSSIRANKTISYHFWSLIV